MTITATSERLSVTIALCAILGRLGDSVPQKPSECIHVTDVVQTRNVDCCVAVLLAPSLRMAHQWGLKISLKTAYTNRTESMAMYDPCRSFVSCMLILA